jgi:hypothetical protein
MARLAQAHTVVDNPTGKEIAPGRIDRVTTVAPACGLTPTGARPFRISS